MLHVKTCGIYKITNTITNETYIGQSRNITKRIATHKENLENGAHVNKGLQEDYDLAKSLDSDYKIFSFEIIKEVKVKDLNKEEMYWINEFNSFERGYNKTIGGIHDETKGHVDYGGGRLFTDEKRIKLITKELTNDELFAPLNGSLILELSDGAELDSSVLFYELGTTVDNGSITVIKLLVTSFSVACSECISQFLACLL